MRRWISPVTGMAVLFGLFLAARLWILAGGKVYTSFDSFSYAYRGDPALDAGPLVSFTGHAPRIWGAPAFFALFPDDSSRVTGQWLLGTLAWALLAWALAGHLRHPWAKLAGVFGVLLIGVLRPVSSWDFAILSESLSISLGVLAFAALLWWLRTGSLPILVVMLACAVWWLFTRLDNAPLLGALIAGLAAVAWFRRREKALRGQAVAAVVVLVAAIGWCLAITPVSIASFRAYSANPDLTHEEGLLLYRLRINVFPDPQVKEVFTGELGMPPCAAADELAAQPEWAIDRFAEAVRGCPEFKRWADTNRETAWGDYARAAPALYAQQLWRLSSDALGGAAYADSPSVLPSPAEKAAFPKSRHTLLITLALLAASAAFALAVGAWRQHRMLMTTAAVAAAAAFGSTVLTVALSAGEVWRFGLQEAVTLRLAIVILLACGVDALAARRRPPVSAT